MSVWPYNVMLQANKRTQRVMIGQFLSAWPHVYVNAAVACKNNNNNDNDNGISSYTILSLGNLKK